MPALEDTSLEKFALAYAGHRNSTRAAIEAGLPTTLAQDLLYGNPLIAARVRELWGQAMANAGVSAERVIQELARVAFASARDLYDSEGELVPVHDLSDDVAATISGLEVETRWEKDPTDPEGGARPVVNRKYKRADKMAALGLLARHFKVVGDEGDGVNALASALAGRLQEARKRAFDTSQAEDATVVQPAQIAHHVPPGEDPLTGEPIKPLPDFVPKPVVDSTDGMPPRRHAHANPRPVIDTPRVPAVPSRPPKPGDGDHDDLAY